MFKITDFKRPNRIEAIRSRKESINSAIHSSFILFTNWYQEGKSCKRSYRLTKSEACVAVRHQANKEKSSVHLVQLLFHHRSNVLVLQECASHSLLSTSSYFPQTHLSLGEFVASSFCFWKVLSDLATTTPFARFRLRHNSCSQRSDWHSAKWPQGRSD